MKALYFTKTWGKFFNFERGHRNGIAGNFSKFFFFFNIGKADHWKYIENPLENITQIFLSA